MDKPRIYTIVGPTASGKTSLSIELAELLSKKYKKNVEIISADSRQVYKHIPIATAQPPAEILKKFKHYFINELELEEDFNAGSFGIRGREIIKNIYGSGKLPVIAGGSGLYIDSLADGLFDYEDLSGDIDLKQSQKQIREKLVNELKMSGKDKLLEELKNVDPETLNKMQNITERRLIRAIEVYYLTGIPISEHRNKKINIGFDTIKIGIKLNRDELYERINERVDKMIESGLIDEVKILKEKGYHYNNYNSLNTVGVKEVFDRLNNIISHDRMIELIKQNTRRFAKRQNTWFKRYKDIKWITSSDELTDIIL